MYLKSLVLQNFRSYKKKAFKFSENTTVLAGDNGIGKTNVLEAIFLLAIGESFRAKKSEQAIFYGEELGRIIGEVGEEELELVLTVGEVQGKKTSKKRYIINGVGKRKMDFVGRLFCVLFRPEDIEIVLGSPSERRDYLDSVLNQVDREYRRCNLAYRKGLRQRNRLLEKIREGEAERKQLLFWDQLIIRNGEVMSNKREEYLEYLTQNLKNRGLDLRLIYDKSGISEERLKKYAQQEVAAGTSLVGPHRDDFVFVKQREGKLKKDLSIFGSRGEQRMAVLAVKLAELEFMEDKTQERPLLLLDDVFSELDEDNREEVFKLLEKQQTIVTTAEEELLPEKYLKKVEVFRL